MERPFIAAAHLVVDPSIKRDLQFRWQSRSERSRLRGEIAYFAGRGYRDLTKGGEEWRKGRIVEAHGWVRNYLYGIGPDLHRALSDLHAFEIAGVAGLDGMAAGIMNGKPWG